MASLDVDNNAAFRSGAGAGAGAFLLYPVDPECELETPLSSQAELPRVSETCVNQDAQSNVCNTATDKKGNYAAGCAPGGGRLKKHGSLARAVGGLARRWCRVDPLYKQRIPELDKRL